MMVVQLGQRVKVIPRSALQQVKVSLLELCEKLEKAERPASGYHGWNSR